MLRTIQRFINNLSAHFTIWQVLYGSGIVSVGALTAWAAAATEWIAAYGPIGWWGAGIIGALLAILGFWLIARTRMLFQLVRFRNRVLESSTINPLETVFRNQRIFLRDLTPPIGGVVSGKTFIGCQLIGPANLIFENCHMAGNGGDGIDGIIITKEARPTNGLGFSGCTFQQCQFYLVTFMVPEVIYRLYRLYNWEGVNLITAEPPEEPASSNEPPLPLSPPEPATETPR
jgi:hypothetical protein